MRRLLTFIVLIGLVAFALVAPQSVRDRIKSQVLAILSGEIFDAHESERSTQLVPEEWKDYLIDRSELGWYEWLERDEEGNLKNVYLRLEADSDEFDQFGENWGKPHFVVRCMESKTAVYVVWGYDLESNTEPPPIAFQVDDGPIVPTTWKVSADYRATGLWNDEGIEWLSGLERAHTLAVHIKSRDAATPRRVTFNIELLGEKLGPLREKCGW